MQNAGYLLLCLGAVLILIAFGGARIKFWVAEVDRESGGQPARVSASIFGVLSIVVGLVLVILGVPQSGNGPTSPSLSQSSSMIAESTLSPSTTAPSTTPIPTTAATMTAPKPAGDAAGYYADLIRGTSQLAVTGPNCDGTETVSIRFYDDGTEGCAELKQGFRGSLRNGVNIALVPVTAVGRGTIFALMYAYREAGPLFVGILPGDGSGDLSVTIENGVIVERNGNFVKRSTYINGKVVEI